METMIDEITLILPAPLPDEASLRKLAACGVRDILLLCAEAEPLPGAPDMPRITALPVSGGAGHRLKQAAAWCQEHRPDARGAVLLDGSVPYGPEALISLAGALKQPPETLHVGVRPECPGGGLVRRVLGLACGVHISDCYGGAWAVPASMLPLLAQLPAEGSGFGIELLSAAHRAKIPIAEAPLMPEASLPVPAGRALADLARMFRTVLKYLSSSLASFLVDLGLFSLVNLLLAPVLDGKLRLFVATAAARVCSSLVNYTLNRTVVFRDQGSVGRSIVRYYTLAVVQAAASYGLLLLVSTLVQASPAAETPLKLAVDMLLFLISYQVQRRWVFR